MAPSMAPRWPIFHRFNEDAEIKLPEMTSASVIGITVAICGNVLISLALNFQKLAHKRLEREKARKAHERELETRRNSGSSERSDITIISLGEGASQTTIGPRLVVETAPLLQHSYSDPSHSAYGTSSSGGSIAVPPLKKKFMSRLNPFSRRSRKQRQPSLMEVHEDTESGESAHFDEVVNLPSHDHNGKDVNGHADLPPEHGKESDYLKSKLWWLGFLLMNIGECGNFISYAFAPASVVAPLGTFALMANCVFAPLMLHESFHKLDLLGIMIATLGAVTVVISSGNSDERLDPTGLLKAISQRPFIIFTGVYIVAAVVLAGLSQSSYGRRYVIVDIGLCAIFGGFTVLSTKGISTLLTLEWIEVFTEWITYPVIAVLIFTGVGQIRYLNRALKRFDSKVVIPIQFVFFTLSAIIGSAILYGDFKRATFHQMLTFLYGCAATFLGVFIIAWSPPDDSLDAQDEDYEAGTNMERVERSLRPGERSGHGNSAGITTRNLGRRKVAMVSPIGSPILRRRPSSISVIGLSPAQHLLLVHTPPRDQPELYWEESVQPVPTPAPAGSSYRRRSTSWFGEERPTRALVMAGGNV